VLVAPAGEPHGDAVAEGLSRRGVAHVRMSLDDLASRRVELVPGRGFTVDDVTVRSGWTVWWFRAGAVPTSPAVVRGDEQQLRAAETTATLLGGLACVAARWIDEPFTVMRAELKLYQLDVAARLGVATPESVVSSDPAVGARFAARSNVIAKALSSGPGPAPFADDVGPDLFPTMRHCPVLLQERVEATADLRVVVVGGAAWAWRRPRMPAEPLDWRSVDAYGRDFRSAHVPAHVGKAARRITAELGLSCSAQDWLETGDGRYVFLEANPAGAWLFLDGSRDTVLPALLDLLSGAGGV
jgi:hypothetical protein